MAEPSTHHGHSARPIDPEKAEYVEGVYCVVMPCCAFTYDAIHTDAHDMYTCPLCEQFPMENRIRRLEEALRHARRAIDDMYGAGFDSTRQEIAVRARVRIAEVLDA